jgi:hypothetical protein
MLGDAEISKSAIALIPIAVAFLRWPAIVRWPMTALVVLGPAFFVAMAHWYFHASTNYPLLVLWCFGIAAHVLLLFGKMTSGRLAAGSTALLAYVGIACVGGPLAVKAESPLPPDVCEARIEALRRRLEAYLADESAVVELHAAKLPPMHDRPRATGPRTKTVLQPTHPLRAQ